MDANPVVGQPPSLVNLRRTSLAFPRGASTHRGMMTAKSPVIWMMRTMPSTRGNLVASEVLKMIEKAMTAIAKRVPCHDWYT